MLTLENCLERTQKTNVAIGHFNISDFTLLKAVAQAAQELQLPVLVGVSEGEREFIGIRQIAALVRSFREELETPIFLNADHTHTLHNAVEAHGGSGTDDQDLQKAIAAGINIVHINTELRVAWRRGLESALSSQPNQVVPYKILPFAVESVKQVVRSRLELFNTLKPKENIA